MRTWVDVLRDGGTMEDYTTDPNQREALRDLELRYRRIRQQIEEAGLCKWEYRKPGDDTEAGNAAD